jgi:4-amino-4-deoxy-L-arabinose transferase-like glycosyltransferase
MYILTARSLAAGQGYSMLGEPFTIRPPGFSLLIAPLLAWGGTDFHALNLLVSAFGVAGVLLFFAYARARIGDLLAFLLAAAIWLNPGYQRLCNQTLSDVPGFALLFALLWMERWVTRRPVAWRALVLGAALGLAAYVRTGLLLLVPAMALAWLLTRRSGPQRLRTTALAILCLGAGAVAVQVPWSLRNRAVDQGAAVDQTLLHSYSTAMWHADMGDPASPRLPLSAVLGRVQQRGPSFLGVLGSRMGERARGAGSFTTAAVLLAAGAALLAWRRSSAELFAFANVAVILVYFGFASRLVLPVYALLLLSAVELLGWGFLRGLLRLAPGPSTVLVALAILGWIAFDWNPRQGWDDVAREHRVYQDITGRFARELRAEDRPAAVRGWHYSVYLERPVFSLEFVVERAGTAQAAEALIDRRGIDTVLLSPGNPVDGPYFDYFEGRYGSIAKDPLARVYRVRSPSGDPPAGGSSPRR